MTIITLHALACKVHPTETDFPPVTVGETYLPLSAFLTGRRSSCPVPAAPPGSGPSARCPAASPWPFLHLLPSPPAPHLSAHNDMTALHTVTWQLFTQWHASSSHNDIWFHTWQLFTQWHDNSSHNDMTALHTVTWQPCMQWHDSSSHNDMTAIHTMTWQLFTQWHRFLHTMTYDFFTQWHDSSSWHNDMTALHTTWHLFTQWPDSSSHNNIASSWPFCTMTVTALHIMTFLHTTLTFLHTMTWHLFTQWHWQNSDSDINSSSHMTQQLFTQWH